MAEEHTAAGVTYEDLAREFMTEKEIKTTTAKRLKQKVDEYMQRRVAAAPSTALTVTEAAPTSVRVSQVSEHESGVAPSSSPSPAAPLPLPQRAYGPSLHTNWPDRPPAGAAAGAGGRRPEPASSSIPSAVAGLRPVPLTRHPVTMATPSAPTPLALSPPVIASAAPPIAPPSPDVLSAIDTAFGPYHGDILRCTDMLRHILNTNALAMFAADEKEQISTNLVQTLFQIMEDIYAQRHQSIEELRARGVSLPELLAHRQNHLHALLRRVREGGLGINPQ